ncbi:hypothetical protein CC86DRAFT_172057 [Ophiobolus disseminans]|uniref:Protein kinase domain-containing protein n=1 Tax=Ophiobolus disseminans TaxID=1469910 RepID=A0A6A7A8H1_9PLEO|nr:hypothetical protein CC86DRAFT_172057 [Ophiobolus disseminans]
MASASTYSSWPVMTMTLESSSTSTPSPSPALDFLAAVATLDLVHYDATHLGLTDAKVRRIDERAIGQGGFAVVERGKTPENQPVAVKRIRTSTKDTTIDFGRQLHRICLELRILGHPPLKQHRNIVDVVGYCLSDSLGVGNPFLGLVMEYSSLGTLKDFLLGPGMALSDEVLVSFIDQVAAGLDVLHACSICHGDVKIQNVLVFANGESWTLKVSDFGESTVISSEDPAREVELSFGTPLLNAPEVRKAFNESNTLCSIEAAIRTDVFSFGLLIWEVMKRGSSYFDKTWCGTFQKTVDQHDMEEYLDTLPRNGLLSKVCDHLSTHFDDARLLENLVDALQRSLQDDPGQRSGMQDIRTCLNNSVERSDLAAMTAGVADYKLCSWSIRQSVFQLHVAALWNAVILEKSLPFEVQELIVAELRQLADSEASSMSARSHAAMCIAEFHCFGFGVLHDKQQVAAWVLKALNLGSTKALAWYPRICVANNIPTLVNERARSSFEFEETLSHLAPELYLSDRIRLQVQLAAQHMRTSVFKNEGSTKLQFALFDAWEIDELSPIHVAALLGQDDAVQSMLHPSTACLQSPLGFSAIHFACIGGNISTLRVLLDPVSARATNTHGVTPLHLCIFFSEPEVNQAVTLLFDEGAQPDATCSSAIYWEYHDIELNGTPLDWATSTRNRGLMKRLLPYAQDGRSLKIAITNYYSELVQDIIDHARQASDSVRSTLLEMGRRFGPIQKPFGHWIAHGSEHTSAVGKTLRVCQENSLCATSIDDYAPLFGLASGTPFADNLALIVYCAKSMPREDVKRADLHGQTILSHAISACMNAEIWRAPLEAILDLYSVNELETHQHYAYSFLQIAVTSESILGARLLLERGVNVNQRHWSGSTALSMCRHTNKQMLNLLKEFGADDKVQFGAGAGNMVSSGVNAGQAANSVLQRTLGDGPVTAYGEALHDTLNSVIDTTVHATEDSSWSQSLDEPDLHITLTQDEAKALRLKLEIITLDQLSDLKLMINDDQIDLIRRFDTQATWQQIDGLNLTVKVGQQALDNLFDEAMDELLGEDVTMRLLNLYGASIHAQPEKDEPSRNPEETKFDAIDPDRSHQFREAFFKLQLGTENALLCIDNINEAGMTLIQVATYWLHHDSVAALLEAGADASIPFKFGSDMLIYPLQIACVMGRLWSNDAIPQLAHVGKHSMKVARELMLWHRARSDGLFQGITELHLACRMLMLDEIDTLRSKGCSDHQKGHWPGKESPVLCHELAHPLSEDDFFLQFSAMEEARVKAAEGSEVVR